MRLDGILDGALAALDRDLAASGGRKRRRQGTGLRCKIPDCGELVRAREGRAPPYCIDHITQSPIALRISRDWEERLNESGRVEAGGGVDLAHPLALEIIGVGSANELDPVSAGQLARQVDLPLAVCVAVLRAAGVSLAGRSGTLFSPSDVAAMSA